MALDEIGTFMAAIRRKASGSLQGNYSQRRGDQVGAYAIMRDNWSRLAALAGIPEADWRSASAQDSVARSAFSRLYNRYGDWRLVAIAWFDGAPAADEVRKSGLGDYQAEMDEFVGFMRAASTAGYGPTTSRSDVVEALDPDAREAIKRGTTSADQPFQPTAEPERVSEIGDNYQGFGFQVPTVVSGVLPPTPPPAPEVDPRLQTPMAKRMAAILQGLSNSARSNALSRAETSVIDPAQQGDVTGAKGESDDG